MDRMLLSAGMDAALVVGATKFFNQLHPNPTLLSTVTDRMLLSVGMGAALVVGPTNFLINSTPTQPC